MTIYDAIVIGVGTMGSSALYQLSRSGAKVLGIEQFDIIHDKGSHSGQTRIIRKAYFEHSDYVPLLEQAYKGWKMLQEESGEQLMYLEGLAYIGEPNHSVLQGVNYAADKYSISLNPLPHLSPFNISEDTEVILESEAGFILADKAIQSFTKLAFGNGAEIKTNESVIDWKIQGDIVEVRTNIQKYKAKKIIVTAGAYVKKLLPKLSDKVAITRQLLAWVKPDQPELFSISNFKSWVVASNKYQGIFYGFPMLDSNKYGGNGLLKIGHHAKGVEIEPSEVNTFNSKSEEEKIRLFLQEHIPLALGKIQSTTSCLYTNTKDDQFIIDFVPGTQGKIILAGGFSGHGFKFAPIIGETLRDLVVSGSTEYEIDFLKINRF